MSDLRTYECRDCGHVYADTSGDHCPECGGADVLLTTLNVDTSVDSAVVTTSSLTASVEDMEQIADMIQGGELHVDQVAIDLGERKIVFEAENGTVVGTIVQEQA